MDLPSEVLVLHERFEFEVCLLLRLLKLSNPTLFPFTVLPFQKRRTKTLYRTKTHLVMRPLRGGEAYKPSLRKLLLACKFPPAPPPSLPSSCSSSFSSFSFYSSAY